MFSLRYRIARIPVFLRWRVWFWLRCRIYDLARQYLTWRVRTVWARGPYARYSVYATAAPGNFGSFRQPVAHGGGYRWDIRSPWLGRVRLVRCPLLLGLWAWPYEHRPEIGPQYHEVLS